MDRPDDYRRYMRWAAGTPALLQSLQLGGLGRVAVGAMWGLGLLRVGYQGPHLKQACVAWLQPSDGGTQIGDEITPLDVPLAIVCEQPVTVFVRPVGPVVTEDLGLFLAVTPVGALSDRLYATRTVTGVPGTPIVLPQWVRGVAALTPSTFQWLDRSNAPIGAIQTGAHDRPAVAAAIVPVVAGPITLYY